MQIIRKEISVLFTNRLKFMLVLYTMPFICTLTRSMKLLPAGAVNGTAERLSRECWTESLKVRQMKSTPYGGWIRTRPPQVQFQPGVICICRKFPKLSTLVTFGTSSPRVSLLSGGCYFQGIVTFGSKKTVIKLVRLSVFFRNKKRKFVKPALKTWDEFLRSSLNLCCCDMHEGLFMCRLCFWSTGKLVSALIRLSTVSLSLRAGRVFTTSRLLNMAQTFQLPFEQVSCKYVLVAWGKFYGFCLKIAQHERMKHEVAFCTSWHN